MYKHNTNTKRINSLLKKWINLYNIWRCRIWNTWFHLNILNIWYYNNVTYSKTIYFCFLFRALWRWSYIFFAGRLERMQTTESVSEHQWRVSRLFRKQHLGSKQAKCDHWRVVLHRTCIDNRVYLTTLVYKGLCNYCQLVLVTVTLS